MSNNNRFGRPPPPENSISFSSVVRVRNSVSIRNVPSPSDSSSSTVRLLGR
jgi:hypothetical protein